MLRNTHCLWRKSCPSQWVRYFPDVLSDLCKKIYLVAILVCLMNRKVWGKTCTSAALQKFSTIYFMLKCIWNIISLNIWWNLNNIYIFFDYFITLSVSAFLYPFPFVSNTTFNVSIFNAFHKHVDYILTCLNVFISSFT